MKYRVVVEANAAITRTVTVTARHEDEAEDLALSDPIEGCLESEVIYVTEVLDVHVTEVRE